MMYDVYKIMHLLILQSKVCIMYMCRRAFPSIDTIATVRMYREHNNWLSKFSQAKHHRATTAAAAF